MSRVNRTQPLLPTVRAPRTNGERRRAITLQMPLVHQRNEGILNLYGARLDDSSDRAAHEPAETIPAAPLHVSTSPSSGKRFGFMRRAGALAIVAGLAFGSLAHSAEARQRYTVEEGDTLTSIASEFGIEATTIVRAPFMVDAPHLYPGEIVVVPQPGEEITPDSYDEIAANAEIPFVAGSYVVQPGDWYQGIADKLGVDVDALFSVNGIGWNTPLVVGERLLVPPGAKDWTGADIEMPGAENSDAGWTDPIAGAHVWVPTYVQQRSLSCEYASVYIATSAFGEGISEYVFDDWVPISLNPHYGYRGDINGWWGNYDDYGIYPEPLVPVLNHYGYAGEVAYTFGDTEFLTNHLDAGNPVIVWLALWGDTGLVFDDEGSYTVYAGEHVVVAYSYDEGGVWVSDPADGTYKYINWGTFRWMWGISDGMSLAVYPY